MIPLEVHVGWQEMPVVSKCNVHLHLPYNTSPVFCWTAFICTYLPHNHCPSITGTNINNYLPHLTGDHCMAGICWRYRGTGISTHTWTLVLTRHKATFSPSMSNTTIPHSYRHPTGIAMLLLWYRHDIVIVSLWYRHDIDMISSWYRCSITMVSPWYRFDIAMVPL